jgi:hypothetical protein
VLSVEVKSKRSILESLELYIQGDLLDGDNKVVAMEAMCISHTGDLYSVHV